MALLSYAFDVDLSYCAADDCHLRMPKPWPRRGRVGLFRALAVSY
jgi:hypothetical protein